MAKAVGMGTGYFEQAVDSAATLPLTVCIGQPETCSPAVLWYNDGRART